MRTLTRAQIVVGVDGSPSSVSALQCAQKLAPALGATIRVVIAWDYPPKFPGYVPLDTSEFAEVAKEHLSNALYAAFRGDVPDDLQSSVVYAHPVQALIDASRDAALLIVGRHGRGSLHHLFLVSVSTACISEARCPVLVVREAPGSI
ncbi:universal stress protein [Arthrobacter bussei]|uniref:Universal stress protein n=1 Tax=Arthrobacter bussei TaxID=2594179 RepID=A0A7X1TMR4_9MICC|nr:universal stress protein [Arthrobacter bussei]